MIAVDISANDLEDLVGSVDTYAELSSPAEGVFLLPDASGKRLAGNLRPSARRLFDRQRSGFRAGGA